MRLGSFVKCYQRIISGRVDKSEATVEVLEPRLLLSGTHYVVDSLLDVVADDGVVTLREAIEAANLNEPVTGDVLAGSDSETDIIVFSESLLSDGPAVITLSGSELVIADDLVLTGLGSDRLIIDAQGASRIFNIEGEDVTVFIDAITISGGWADKGGGIYIQGGILTTSGCDIRGNQSNERGGGIYNNEGLVTIDNCLMSDNHATKLGGGIYNSGGALTINNSSISGNAAEVSGGGIYNFWRYSILSIVDSEIINNTAFLSGGGIYNNSGTTTLIECTVSDNLSNENGGGIFSNGVMTIRSSRVSGNTSLVHGGGLYNHGLLTVYGCNFEKNVSEYGGAISNFRIASFADCDIRNNMANVHGGGVYTAHDLFLGSCRITENTALLFGGGLFIEGDAVMDECRISANQVTEGDGGGIAVNEGSVSLVDCAIENNFATGNGGGIFNTYGEIEFEGYNSSRDRFINMAIIDNRAGCNGGGLYNHSGQVSFYKTLLFMNQAGESGGGIYNETGFVTVNTSKLTENGAGDNGGGICNRSGEVKLLQGVIVSNIAGTYGGGVCNGAGQVSSMNSTIAYNLAEESGGGIYNRSGVVGLVNTIVTKNTMGDIEGDYQGHHNLVGGDPLFVMTPPRGYHGGPPLAENLHPNLRLLSGSPAIDAGWYDSTVSQVDFSERQRWDDPYVEDTGSGELTYVDIGAYEAGYSIELPNGDFNGDNYVSLRDLDILGENWGMSEGASKADGDANGDGVVSLLDLDILGQTWGMGAMGVAESASQGNWYSQDNANDVDWWEIELEEQDVVFF